MVGTEVSWGMVSLSLSRSIRDTDKVWDFGGMRGLVWIGLISFGFGLLVSGNRGSEIIGGRILAGRQPEV